MSPVRIGVLLLPVFFLFGCANVSLPQSGFATRYYHSDIAPLLGLEEGAGDGSRAGSVAGPAGVDSCDAVARERALDVEAQGFGEDMQAKVYDATRRDCAAWRARFGGPAG